MVSEKAKEMLHTAEAKRQNRARIVYEFLSQTKGALEAGTRDFPAKASEILNAGARDAEALRGRAKEIFSAKAREAREFQGKAAEALKTRAMVAREIHAKTAKALKAGAGKAGKLVNAKAKEARAFMKARTAKMLKTGEAKKRTQEKIVREYLAGFASTY